MKDTRLIIFSWLYGLIWETLVWEASVSTENDGSFRSIDNVKSTILIINETKYIGFVGDMLVKFSWTYHLLTISNLDMFNKDVLVKRGPNNKVMLSNLFPLLLNPLCIYKKTERMPLLAYRQKIEGQWGWYSIIGVNQCGLYNQIQLYSLQNGLILFDAALC